MKELSIKKEPNGNSLSNAFLENIKYRHPKKDPINNITGKAIGPWIEPIPPNKIKSPPPIPSFFLITLNIKFINQSEE